MGARKKLADIVEFLPIMRRAERNAVTLKKGGLMIWIVENIAPVIKRLNARDDRHDVAMVQILVKRALNGFGKRRHDFFGDLIADIVKQILIDDVLQPWHVDHEQVVFATPFEQLLLHGERQFGGRQLFKLHVYAYFASRNRAEPFQN